MHLRSSDEEMCTQVVVGSSSLEFHLCYGSNGGEGFSAEAHGSEGKEIVCAADFRRRMSVEGTPGIRCRHALPIVDHLNSGFPGIGHTHIDACSTGIYSVLYKFFDHRGRALNHLTGCYLIGHGFG